MLMMEETTLVFSTLVEVFLGLSIAHACASGLLHARGGVSSRNGKRANCIKSSPRSWRCFYPLMRAYCRDCVFSTLVEVFLAAFDMCFCQKGLLHARGGVSRQCLTRRGGGWSSPRSWRCFHILTDKVPYHWVFSTLVEVFLPILVSTTFSGCLLHARGGVSNSALIGYSVF